ncbi:cytochrome o ubiquinol oxidase subunit 2 [Kaistia soli DSM 19436]|uniref:Ubiquinol oxidase polypeptide II n=1 Tax=Kaistia soli DSM 19436 TaxID=1122133 RepID=A0A1M5DGB3_9HYPH|nr:ubiquinol oxidase subunit II [Kaistia soli]SHF66073.1 cytochrome o ubiquinol oxidase subunit 2 [Kaistia soli DSM 19436]
MNRFRSLALLPAAVLLGGCNMVVLAPAGDVAVQQRDLIIVSTVLMLLVIVPVMALTVLFAWRYRHSNKEANYQPDWDHSTQFELVIWAAPLLIIICLGAVTWMGTHLLDPYRPLDRLAAGQPVTQEVAPLRVEVVALDWKWLFIYPDYGIATVNELAAPVDRPIDFSITSSAVMNSFFIPALAGQIYAMPGMQTKLHAVINRAGTYEGFSANYSGAGFSQMKFAFHGLSTADFDTWIADGKKGQGGLDRAAYLQIERPSEAVPVQRFASVDPDLYRRILNRCVEPGKMCMSEMMAIDAKGGLGMAGVYNVLPLEYDKYRRRGSVLGAEPGYVASICTPEEAAAMMASRSLPASVPAGSPLIGSGLQLPGTAVPGFTPVRTPSLTLLTGERRPSNS